MAVRFGRRDMGRKRRSPSPPSEPGVRFSRDKCDRSHLSQHHISHPALGQDITPSYTAGSQARTGQTHETEVPVEVLGWITPAPATPNLLSLLRNHRRNRAAV